MSDELDDFFSDIANVEADVEPPAKRVQQMEPTVIAAKPQGHFALCVYMIGFH